MVSNGDHKAKIRQYGSNIFEAGLRGYNETFLGERAQGFASSPILATAASKITGGTKTPEEWATERDEGSRKVIPRGPDDEEKTTGYFRGEIGRYFNAALSAGYAMFGQILQAGLDLLSLSAEGVERGFGMYTLTAQDLLEGRTVNLKQNYIASQMAYASIFGKMVEQGEYAMKSGAPHDDGQGGS